MNKIETLKDGTKVLIRDLTPKDLDLLMKFYNALPEEDRKYLRVDVTDRDVVKQRLKRIETGRINRIIAVKEDEIVADGALEMFDDEWRKHQGELRTLVSQSFQRKGLGMLLMRELYFFAVQKKVEKLIARIMRPQIAARNICRRLGFHEEIVIPDYLRDRGDDTQDMIVMTCDMKEFWKELEHFYMDSDWQKRR